MQGCQRRQPCGAGHGQAALPHAFAAEDGHIAKAAFVAGMQARSGRRGNEEMGAGRGPGRGLAAVQAGVQRVPPDLAAGVAAASREQARLQCQQNLSPHRTTFYAAFAYLQLPSHRQLLFLFSKTVKTKTRKT
jgi:hypothetical protein